MPTTGSGQSAPAIRNIEGDPDALRAVGVDPAQMRGAAMPVGGTPPPLSGKELFDADVEAIKRLKAAGLLDPALDNIGYPRAEVAAPAPLTLAQPARNNAEPVLVVPLPDGLVAEIFVRGGRHQPKHFTALARFLVSIGEMEDGAKETQSNHTSRRARPRPATGDREGQ